MIINISSTIRYNLDKILMRLHTGTNLTKNNIAHINSRSARKIKVFYSNIIEILSNTFRTILSIVASAFQALSAYITISI